MRLSLGAKPVSAAGLAGLEGSITALVTPFRDGVVDVPALMALCQRQIRAGSVGLVVCGTTGEAPALSMAEQRLVVETAVAAVAGRMPVIAGCGGAATAASVEAAVCAVGAGAAGLLCAPPPYSRPTQDGIVAHVRAVAGAVEVPVLLYDVPSRTGVAVADATVAALFEAGLIVGIKDATADLARPARLRMLCGQGLLQYTGDDATSAAYRAVGGHGCISVSSNLAPAVCAAMHRAWAGADLVEFARTRDLLAPLHRVLFMETNPVPVKMAMALAGLCRGELRLPLLPASPGTVRALAPLVAIYVAAEQETVGAAGRRFSLVR